MITLQEKRNKIYVEPQNSFKVDVIDVDTSRNIVSGILNTFNFIDFDLDMLIMGSAAKTINNSGPESNAKAKIQHLKDHRMLTDFIVGRFLNLEETVFDGREVIKFESKILDSDILLKYQEKVLNQHSIGFRYVDIQLADRNSSNPQDRALFEEFIPRAINPEVAEKTGFFFVVKEIELFEGSTVVFGSNSQTQTTDIKSKDPKTQELYLLTYLDAMKRHTHNNKSKISPDEFRMMNLNIKQFEQAIIDIQKPPIKEMLKPSGNGISEDQKARELFNLIKI